MNRLAIRKAPGTAGVGYMRCHSELRAGGIWHLKAGDGRVTTKRLYANQSRTKARVAQMDSMAEGTVISRFQRRETVSGTTLNTYNEPHHAK